MNGVRSTRCLLALAAVGAVTLLLGSGVASAGVRPASVTVDLSSYGAVCDGSHDDGPALDAALAAVQNGGGGTVVVPAGDCRIVQTDSHTLTDLAGPVTIQGSSATAADSTLSLDTDVLGAFRVLFHVSGSDVALKNLTLSRASDLFGIFLDVGGASGLDLTNVVMDGHQDTINGQDIDAVKLSPQGGETISDTSFSQVTIRNSNYGLFQAGVEGEGDVDGFTVDDSTFTGNYYDDLEFNGPTSSMSNITVTNSTFSDNKATDLAAAYGFGVGMANVQTGKIQNNTFDGYAFEPVHIEDRSSHITVDNNQFSNSFTASLDFASHVFIVDDVHFVDVTNNTFDTSANSNAIACIYASPGGAGLPAPTDITVTGNTFKLRPNATDTADYTSDGMAKSGNTYVTLP